MLMCGIFCTFASKFKNKTIMDKETLNSLIEAGVPEEYYMMEGVVYMYTFPNGKVYIGRTCREPEVCHAEHLHPTPHLCNREYLSALREQGEPKYEIHETVQNAIREDLLKALNEREDFYIQKYNATNPDKGYNRKFTLDVDPEAKAKRIEEQIENYATMHLNSKYHLFQKVASKLMDVKSMNEEERKFYDKYFGEDNMFYGADIRNDFYREEYENYALFMLEEESKQIAEEFVHENESELLSIFFKPKA